jgi:hypothetical protein
MLAFIVFPVWRCREVVKPAPFAMGFLAGYAGSNPASASAERSSQNATATINALDASFSTLNLNNAPLSARTESGANQQTGLAECRPQSTLSASPVGKGKAESAVYRSQDPTASNPALQ